jgi:hypothetical protein
VFHASLLTPYVETELHGPNYPEPPSDISEGDPEFEVEQIVRTRRIGKKKTLQYKIRWKGYSPAHDSWEPASQVHAPNLIEEFQKISSSKKNNTTINCGSALEIMTKSYPPQQHRAYSSQAEVKCRHSNIDPSENREPDPSSKDKKRR